MGIFILISVVTLVPAARLPTDVGDSDTWGDILNTFLNVSHNTTGHLKDDTISSNQITDNSINDSDISNTTNLTLGEKITFTLGEVIDNIVNGWIKITGGLNVTENFNVVGNATATYFLGNGSQLTDLTESQISDLQNYYLKSNPFSYFNTTNPQVETDPKWTANQSSYFTKANINASSKSQMIPDYASASIDCQAENALSIALISSRILNGF